jgi:hypothetical protein
LDELVFIIINGGGRMRMSFKNIGFREAIAAFSLCAFHTPALAFDESVTAAISDGCIATAGYTIAEDPMYEIEIGKIEKDPPVQKSVIGAALATVGTQLATTVIEGLFEKTSNYIKEKAKDVDVNYSDVFPTSLYEAGPAVYVEKDKKVKLPIKLNPRLRCFTFVLGNVAVPSPKREISSKVDIEAVSRWKPKWAKAGPPKTELLRRLKAANLLFVNPDGRSVEPWLVFEAVIVFSPDGKAIQFVPRYFRAFRLAEKGGSVKRSVAISVTADMPGQTAGSFSSQLIQQSFIFNDVYVSQVSDKQTIRGVSSTYGFGPTLVGAILGKQEWIKFSAGTYSASDYVEKTFADEEFGSDVVLGLEPLNVRSKIVVTEKASDLAVFLAKFIDAHSVTTTLSSALIQELGLISDEEKKKKMIEKINNELEQYKFWRDKYKETHPEGDETAKVIAEYQDEIDKLTIDLGKIEKGCDPLGHNEGATCD